MHSYVATYQMPHDDPAALEARVKVRYPVAVDRVLGLGELPGLRLQRALAREGVVRRRDQVLVWSHWLWFLVPHGTVAYVLLRHRERFPRAALAVYATFDLGLIGYWAVPTAPPWYAAQEGVIRARAAGPGAAPDDVRARRGVLEERWAPLYSVLGGNPLAAMPSLHFATSVQSAHVLSDIGRAHGAIGWAYALTLGFALVYLGEHYVIDLPWAWRSPRASGAAGPARRGCCGAVGWRGAGARGAGARMTERAGGPGRRRRRTAPTTTRRCRGSVITRERALIFGLFVASAVAFLYFVLPKLAGLGDTWHRLGEGDPPGC